MTCFQQSDVKTNHQTRLGILKHCEMFRVLGIYNFGLSKTFDAKNDNKETGLSSHCLFALWRVWTLEKPGKNSRQIVMWSPERKQTNKIVTKSQKVLSSSAAGNWKKNIFFFILNFICSLLLYTNIGSNLQSTIEDFLSNNGRK